MKDRWHPGTETRERQNGRGRERTQQPKTQTWNSTNLNPASVNKKPRWSMTWNWWCHDAVTQSRVVWVVRGLTLVMSNHILFRWEVEALLLHPRAHTTETATAGREWWRHHSVEDDRKVMVKMHLSLTWVVLSSAPGDDTILPLNVPLLWIWAGSKTGESLFARQSVPVVSTSTCGSSRYGTLTNSHRIPKIQIWSDQWSQEQRDAVGIDQRYSNELEKSHIRSLKTSIHNSIPIGRVLCVIPKEE